VQNWNLILQKDLPFSLQMVAQYNGTKGTRAMQQFYPNTYPVGTELTCTTCLPSGFTYMTSNGNSTREAGIFQLRRRLRSGFTATLQYTYAKAIDDAVLGGAGQGGSVVAQNWLNLAGERGLSNFDRFGNRRRDAAHGLERRALQGVDLRDTGERGDGQAVESRIFGAGGGGDGIAAAELYGSAVVRHHRRVVPESAGVRRAGRGRMGECRKKFDHGPEPVQHERDHGTDVPDERPDEPDGAV
jgi:hypothetical protein